METHLPDGGCQAIGLPADYRQFPGAPAAGTELCRVDDIAEGAAKVFSFGGGTDLFEMFVLRWPTGMFAYVNDCPHARSPLDWRPGEFLTRDKTLLLCTMHGARFTIEDGVCVLGPCLGNKLTKVPVEVNGGVISISKPVEASADRTEATN